MHPLSFVLHPDFRHCFICVEVGGSWVEIDSSGGLPVIRLCISDDIVERYRKLGASALVETYRSDRPLFSPFAFRNCVGLVKAILCVRSMCLTPYGLYKYLAQDSNFKHYRWRSL